MLKIKPKEIQTIAKETECLVAKSKDTAEGIEGIEKAPERGRNIS